jgi:hypothetical protein
MQSQRASLPASEPREYAPAVSGTVCAKSCGSGGRVHVVKGRPGDKEAALASARHRRRTASDTRVRAPGQRLQQQVLTGTRTSNVIRCGSAAPIATSRYTRGFGDGAPASHRRCCATTAGSALAAAGRCSSSRCVGTLHARRPPAATLSPAPSKTMSRRHRGSSTSAGRPAARGAAGSALSAAPAAPAAGASSAPTPVPVKSFRGSLKLDSARGAISLKFHPRRF